MKKNMKKRILSFLLVFALAAATGCAKNEPVVEQVVPAPSESAAVSESPEEPAEEPAEETTEESASEMTADIVVIGAGGAGMTAAIQATQDGATNVVILEKMAFTGGNSTRSTGGLNAAETKYQEDDGVEDSIELFVADTMKGGREVNNKELVQTLAENSAGAVDWINEIGGDLSVVGMFAGASVKRIHRPSDTSAVGPMLVETLNKKVAELGIPVLMSTKAEKILVDDSGAVVGVEALGAEGLFTIDCRAVVLATGGFGANNAMVVEYNSELAGFGTTNQVGATGDGIAMAVDAGAALVDMEQIQTHPTVNPDTSDMYTEGVRGNGAILVNTEGNRFVNEMETRDVVSEAILAQPDEYCWLLFDQTVRDSLKAIEDYINKGIIYESDTIEGLAEEIGVPAENLRATIESYTKIVEAQDDAELGRNTDSMGSDLTTPKYYAGKCGPAIHHTMGGVRINTSTEILRDDGSKIDGFFAAGEVTGGVHGANRLGGNAVADIVVFGRIAGSAAEKYIAENGGNTDATILGGSVKATPEAQGNYKDGVYEGIGKGFNGDIRVEVTVEGGNIVDVEILEINDTAGIREGAEIGVIDAVIRTQELQVDTVTGATNSSKGIIEAITNAMENAK